VVSRRRIRASHAGLPRGFSAGGGSRGAVWSAVAGRLAGSAEWFERGLAPRRDAKGGPSHELKRVAPGYLHILILTVKSRAPLSPLLPLFMTWSASGDFKRARTSPRAI